MINNNIVLINDDFFDYQENLSPQSFDLILTDPPYNMLQEAGQDWDVAIDWERTEEVFSRLLKPNGQVIMFCDINLFLVLFVKFGSHLVFKHFHIWHKPGGAPSNKYHPISNSEHILVFRPKRSKVSDLTFNPKSVLPAGDPYTKRNASPDMPTRRQQKSPVNINKTGERWVKTVLSGPSKPNMKNDERTSHPTQKPLNILQDLIRCYSNPGDMVLDPFAGSGSTLIACDNEGRKCIGIEKDERFFQEALQRIENHQSQQDIFKSAVKPQENSK
jgi:site-specific DNA-methyltransferase (adenine-specific)